MSNKEDHRMITDRNQVCFLKMVGRGLQEELFGGDIILGSRILPPHSALHPNLEALDRFNLSVVIGMKVSFCGADMGMTHQSLDGPKIIFIIQKGRGKGLSHSGGRKTGFICPQITCLPDSHFGGFTP